MGAETTAGLREQKGAPEGPLTDEKVNHELFRYGQNCRSVYPEKSATRKDHMFLIITDSTTQNRNILMQALLMILLFPTDGRVKIYPIFKTRWRNFTAFFSKFLRTLWKHVR